MVPGLAADCYEQQPGDWEQALATAMTGLRKKLDAAGIMMEVQAIGISGQMHGEVLADDLGRSLGPARLWCDSRNEAEGHELTEKLGVKCPKRITSARSRCISRILSLLVLLLDDGLVIIHFLITNDSTQST